MSGQQRLTLEHAPPLPWGSSVRYLFERERWDRLRRFCYRYYHYRCQVCGKGGKMYCDAVWEFDERCGIVHLRGFTVLCRYCHYCRHWDIALAAVDAGNLDGGAMNDHCRRMVGGDEDAYQAAVDAAHERAARRQDMPWYVDLHEFVEAVPDTILAEIDDVLVRSERRGHRSASKRGKRKRAQGRKPRPKEAR